MRGRIFGVLAIDLPASQIDNRVMPGDGDTEALVGRAQAGDRDAFGALISANYEFIYNVAYKWMGAQAGAEDVAQDVCVKLAGALGQFDGRAKFTSWLYRVTLNVVRDRLRAEKRRRRQVDAIGNAGIGFSPAEQDEAVTRNEIWRAVRGLPDKQRDAVLLVYAQEMTHAGAAKVMGCKEATVSWYVHEAKKTLRGLL